MRPRSSNWLLLSLVVLSGLVAFELHYGVGARSAGPALGQGGAPVEAVPSVLFALAERDRYSETLERPLFMPNRQPPGDAPALSMQAPRAARPNAKRYALSAIIIVDDERIALLTDTATGGLNRVREGESVAGWQVEEINEDSAVLSNGDTREELSLRIFGAPPPPLPQSSRQRAAAGASGRVKERDAEAIPDRPRRPKRGPRQIQKSLDSKAN